MRFNTLYEKIINYFPKTIDISDGKVDAMTNGFLSNNLSLAWNHAESIAENEWENLLVWIFYQTFHAEARLLFEDGRDQLLIVAKINSKSIKERYFEALQDEGYEDMLNEYER